MFVFFHSWPATGDKITKILILTSWELLNIYDESGKNSSNVKIMQLYCFYVIVDQIFGLGNPDPFLIKLHVFYYDFVIYYIMYSNIHYSSLFFLPFRHFPYQVSLTEGASRPHYVVSHVSVHWSLVPGDQTGTPPSNIVAYTVGAPWAAVLIGSH